MGTKFAAGDPYQEKPLERRAIIEAADKAAIKMAELLGQDANHTNVGAQSGQHAAIPSPKKDQGVPHETKLFLSQKVTSPQDDSPRDLDRFPELDSSEEDIEQGQKYYDNGECDDWSGDYWGVPPEEEMQEELITDILEQRAAHLYMAFQPPEPVEGPADTMFIVRRSKTDSRRVVVRAHSQVLMKMNGAFDELIGYRPPTLPTPINMDQGSQRIGNIRCDDEDYLKKVVRSMDLPPYLGGSASEQTPNSSEMGRQQSRAFHANAHSKLGSGAVVDNLQDSTSRPVAREFQAAVQDLEQVHRWDLLPRDSKLSSGGFEPSTYISNNTETETAKRVEDAKEQVVGKSLESTFLGMVGRRGSKEMLGVLNNLSKGGVERHTSQILLDNMEHEELTGKARLDLDTQQRQVSISPLGQLKKKAFIATHDKRISPSFLEMQHNKFLLDVAEKERDKIQTEEMMQRRKTSKAAVAAFERKKRMSMLEEKTIAELEFKPGYDGGWRGSHKVSPNLVSPGRRMSAAALSLSIAAMEKAKERSQARRISHTIGLEQSPSTQRKSVHFEEGPGDPWRDSGASRGSEGLPEKTTSPKVERRPSQPPVLSHTREQDRDDVLEFYKQEDIDTLSESSASTLDMEPPCVADGVEYVIEKMHWTTGILYGLMEFIYTEVVHIHCQELADVYRAANEILLSSLTDAIRCKPINHYYRLAMVSDENRKALWDLAEQLTTTANYDNYVNGNEDFAKLKKLCDAFELNGRVERRPYTLLFETGHVAFRNLPVITPGLQAISGQMVLILKDPKEGTTLFEQNLEQDKYLTFRKKHVDRKNEKSLKEMHWLGQWPAVQMTKNHYKAWKVYFFDFKDVNNDIPIKNFVFYKHITSVAMRPLAKEEFSIRFICGIIVCPVLYKALHLGFPNLDIVVGRGAGYFLGGEIHGNSITMTGSPLHLMQACKALPSHMVGRTVLRVSSPTERTFIKLWMSTNRFGVDLECSVLYFLKPMIQIQKMLEYWHNIDKHANYSVTYPREMVELVAPHDPF